MDQGHLELSFTKRPAYVYGLVLILVAGLWFYEKGKIIPQYGTIFYEMGLQCKEGCGQEKRLKYFQKAVYFNPELSDAYHQMALIYEKLGDKDKELEALLKTAETDRNNAFVFYKIGIRYFERGECELAARNFMWSLKRPIDQTASRFLYIAKTYDELMIFDLALKYYHKLTEMYPEYIEEIYPRVAEIYYFYVDAKTFERKIKNLRRYYKDGLADQLTECFNKVRASQFSNDE